MILKSVLAAILLLALAEGRSKGGKSTKTGWVGESRWKIMRLKDISKLTFPTCYKCVEAADSKRCEETKQRCLPNEMCSAQYDLVGGKVVTTKGCKHKVTCLNLEQNNPDWCFKGRLSSRCTFCCEGDWCNHNFSAVSGITRMTTPGDCENWSKWSECSVTCGQGVQTRRRQCPIRERSKSTGKQGGRSKGKPTIISSSEYNLLSKNEKALIYYLKKETKSASVEKKISALTYTILRDFRNTRTARSARKSKGHKSKTDKTTSVPTKSVVLLDTLETDSRRCEMKCATKPIMTTLATKATVLKSVMPGSTTLKPTTSGLKPLTSEPTTLKPTTSGSTTLKPTTSGSTTLKPLTSEPTTLKPTTSGSTTQTTFNSSTLEPTPSELPTLEPTTTIDACYTTLPCVPYEGEPCEGVLIPCSNGQFCMTEITVLKSDGARIISKTCVKELLCKSLWQETARNEDCRNFLKTNSTTAIANEEIHCDFCCTERGCNKEHLPKVSSLYPLEP